MTKEESVVLFNEIRDHLSENGFVTLEAEGGQKSKNNYKGNYMLFNCPHFCSSVRLFKVKDDEGNRMHRFIRDVRTSYARDLEWNRELAMNFVNGVIEELNGENNTVQESV